jgi:ABC-type branched-subunit amino acid transport system substrate-binding protein
VKRLWIVIGIVAVLAVGAIAVACGSSSSGGGSSASASASASAAPTGPIKVGHIVNLTGPEAMVGQGQKKALEEAFKQMGDINGRPVEVITEDAKGEASGAVDAARKLVESDGVVAIFGPTEIGQKAAVGGYMKTAGIPELIYNPSPIEMFAGNKWIVGSGGGTAQCPTCMGDYLASTEGWTSINTLTEDNSAGRAFMDPLTGVFTQLGGKVLKQQWVPEDVGDFSPYLTTLPAADGLVAWEPGGAGIKLFSQWYATGLYKTMPIAAAFHGGFTDPFIPAALPTNISDEIAGTKAPQAYAPDNPSPENQAFQEAMTPILGFPPADDGISGPYQAALLFQAGVQKGNGDTTPDTLLANILGSSIVGPEGAESFPAGQQFATKTIYILEVAKVPGHAKTFTYKTVQTYEDVPAEGYTPQ